ncbi:MAG TPA: serine hydrolase domain-containing protein [Longimicrobium sp.]|nr:serine hydrolase domain-containing protein [Longimicrobium sp.]
MRPDRRVLRAAAAALLLAALPAAPAALGAQWAAPPADTLARLLAERIESGGAAGVVLGVVERGWPRVVAAGRRGGEGTPGVDARTVFEIGSVSKVLTTTLLAEMAVRGEVALDEPIRNFLPDSVRAPSRGGREITLLDLATATSGLPRLPGNLAPADFRNPYAGYEARDLYAFLAGYTLPRDPGAAYEYSNLGMGLLGHLLALRAGKEYEALVIERILAPLGMRDTRLVLTASMRERLAAGHGAGLEPVGGWDFAVLAGAGGWRSTAEDMLRFLAAQLSPPPGPLGRAIAMTQEPRRPAGPPGDSRIGLGWHVLERNGRAIVWHNGQTGGYHAFLGFEPASGANVLVLANTAADLDDLGLRLLAPGLRCGMRDGRRQCWRESR